MVAVILIGVLLKKRAKELVESTGSNRKGERRRGGSKPVDKRWE
jgi:hypothetical protein